VRAQIDPACLEALQVELLHFVRRGLEDHLKLLVLEQAIRVLAEPSIGRPSRRLTYATLQGSGPSTRRKRFGMHGTCTHLDVERLLEKAASRGPELRHLKISCCSVNH
jgi:hypothetical protein